MKYEFVYKSFIVQMTIGEEITIPETNETLKAYSVTGTNICLHRSRGIYAMPWMFLPCKEVKEASESAWSGGIAENH